MTFGEKIQKLRKEKGLSQEALAERLSVTRQTISKWELNQSTPELEYIAQLSDIFSVSTDYLIKSEPPANDRETDKPAPSFDLKPSRYLPAFIFGILLTSIGSVGMLVFIVLSTLNPWTACVGSYCYEGLLGFLIGTSTLPYFAILFFLFLAGIALSVFGIIKKR